MSQGARSIVEYWRDYPEQRRSAWGPAAADKPPSALNAAAADAWAVVAVTADHQADQLLVAGFLPGHQLVRDLRGIASRAASQANRSRSWSADLLKAESNEIEA